MSKNFFLLMVVLICRLSSSVEILGTWQSDCQNYADEAAGFQSIRPIDIFNADGTAVLIVHAYEKSFCKGKEWDAETIPCTYSLGKNVENLLDTKELDLKCDEAGKKQEWYEIAEVKLNTLRYGNQTGLKPEDRPKKLGNVIYRKIKTVVLDE